MYKCDIIIDAALEKYKAIAAEKVKDELCATCPDKRCEAGIQCMEYEHQVRAKAWDMVQAENN